MSIKSLLQSFRQADVATVEMSAITPETPVSGVIMERMENTFSPTGGKFLIQSLRHADGGSVECSIMAPDGTMLSGIIEESFFEDFMGVPKPNLTPAKRGRIVQENIAYLEAEADRQWRLGNRELVIR